jgi:hypothetical protein
MRTACGALELAPFPAVPDPNSNRRGRGGRRTIAHADHPGDAAFDCPQQLAVVHLVSKLALAFCFLVSGFWFLVSGFGVRVSGFGFRASGFGLSIYRDKDRVPVARDAMFNREWALPSYFQPVITTGLVQVFLFKKTRWNRRHHARVQEGVNFFKPRLEAVFDF